MPQQDPQSPRSSSFTNRHRRHWWWLPFSLAISLLVHLLIGFGVQRFGLLGAPTAPQVGKQAPTVQVTLLSEADIQGKEAPDDALQPKKPTPRETPAPVVVKRTPQRQIEKPGPVDVPQTREPAAVATPNAPPTPQAKPIPRPAPQPTAPPTDTTGNRPNRAPRPLPRGQQNQPDASPQFSPRMADVPDATSRDTAADNSPKPAPRLKPNAPTRTTGDAGSGGRIADLLTIPRMDAPKEELGTNGGTGGGDEGGRGNAVGTGDADGGNGLGISRGIPFGDTLGLTRGGDPDGGGGNSAPGAGGIDRITGSGGGPRYRVQRPTGGGPPVRIVYVLDVSGSMIEGGKIDRAQEALSKAMDELRPEDSFMIVAFSNDATSYSPTLRKATRTAIAQGQINVRSTQPNGQTNLSAALELALAQKDATHIFILSDGEPTRGLTDPKEILTFVQRNNTGHARIITYALGLGENFEGIGLLKKIAQENNGRFDYVNLARR